MDRQAWIDRMVQLMFLTQSAGADPYEVLRTAAQIGYGEDDLRAVAAHFMAREERTWLSEDEIKEGGAAIVAGFESYLASH